MGVAWEVGGGYWEWAEICRIGIKKQLTDAKTNVKKIEIWNSMKLYSSLIFPVATLMMITIPASRACAGSFTCTPYMCYGGCERHSNGKYYQKCWGDCGGYRVDYRRCK